MSRAHSGSPTTTDARAYAVEHVPCPFGFALERLLVVGGTHVPPVADAVYVLVLFQIGGVEAGAQPVIDALHELLHVLQGQRVFGRREGEHGEVVDGVRVEAGGEPSHGVDDLPTVIPQEIVGPLLAKALPVAVPVDAHVVVTVGVPAPVPGLLGDVLSGEAVSRLYDGEPRGIRLVLSKVGIGVRFENTVHQFPQCVDGLLCVGYGFRMGGQVPAHGLHVLRQLFVGFIIAHVDPPSSACGLVGRGGVAVVLCELRG